MREVAEAHGGTVTAEQAPGGGALLRLRLNGVSEDGSLALPSGDGRPHRALEPR